MNARFTTKALFGIIGSVVGLIIGYIFSFWLEVGFGSQLIVALLGAAAGAGIGIGLYGFGQSSFVRSREPYHRRNRVAAIFGTLFGWLVGRSLQYRIGADWPIVPFAALCGAVLLAIVFSASQRGYSRSRPNDAQLAIPLGESYVAEWKLDSVYSKLKVNGVGGGNETALPLVTEYHFMKLLQRWLFPGLLLVFFIWGSKDFANYQAIGRWLRDNPYNWFFVAAGLIVMAVWFRRNRKRLKLIAIRASIYLVVIVLIWLGLRSPYGQAIIDALRSGRPEPWLFAALLCLIWMGFRWVKWFFSFIASTDKRVIVGTVYPFPFPNRLYNLLYPATSSDPKDTVLGNLMGYGHDELDGAGTLDWLFNNLRFVKGHRELASCVIKK